MENIYLWTKVLHLVFVIAWMAGLLYLPRLFIYHATLLESSKDAEIFKIMERRLLKIIINPAMILTWIFGIALVWQGDHWSSAWIHLKILFVIILQIFHILCLRWQRNFANNKNNHSVKFYRMINEIPTILLIGIIICAVFKF